MSDVQEYLPNYAVTQLQNRFVEVVLPNPFAATSLVKISHHKVKLLVIISCIMLFSFNFTLNIALRNRSFQATAHTYWGKLQ